MVPVQRESMYRYDVHRVQDTMRSHQLNEFRINGRDSAEHNLQIRIYLAHGIRPKNGHFRKFVPMRIQFEIPMGEIVRLIPKHHRFDHEGFSSLSGFSWPAISK